MILGGLRSGWLDVCDLDKTIFCGDGMVSGNGFCVSGILMEFGFSGHAGCVSLCWVFSYYVK